MLRIFVSGAFVGALLLSSPVIASNPSSGSETATEAPAKAPKEKRICKRQELEMGSRMASKVCKTESEWKAEAEAGRERFRDSDKD